MARPVMTLRVNDRVEDRSLFSGEGRVLYISGTEARVAFDNGGEEAIDLELFRRLGTRRWKI